MVFWKCNDCDTETEYPEKTCSCCGIEMSIEDDTKCLKEFCVEFFNSIDNQKNDSSVKKIHDALFNQNICDTTENIELIIQRYSIVVGAFDKSGVSNVSESLKEYIFSIREELKQKQNLYNYQIAIEIAEKADRISFIDILKSVLIRKKQWLY